MGRNRGIFPEKKRGVIFRGHSVRGCDGLFRGHSLDHSGRFDIFPVCLGAMVDRFVNYECELPAKNQFAGAIRRE